MRQDRRRGGGVVLAFRWLGACTPCVAGATAAERPSTPSTGGDP